jgi:hypothetical protein
MRSLSRTVVTCAIVYSRVSYGWCPHSMINPPQLGVLLGKVEDPSNVVGIWMVVPAFAAFAKEP